MQKINDIIDELKAIMTSNNISQTSVVTALDGKCSRNTVLCFFNGEKDCRLSTFLAILDVCSTILMLETEKSKQAILSGNISEYCAKSERLWLELSKAEKCIETLKENNKKLTDTVNKQQKQIEKYMERMENAENALYRANDDMRRKDAKIVSLLEKMGKW